MATPLPGIRVSFDSVEHLRQEYARTIRKGGVFAPGADPLPERSLCTLLLTHPATLATFELQAEVVYVKADNPGRGIGVQLLDFGPSAIAALEAFINAETAAGSGPQQEPGPQAGDTAAPEPVADETEEQDAPQRLAVATLHERIRSLSLTEQLKLAREGGLQERVALERIFGKTVWEAILQNQRVTPPEVARIARMGAAPIPVLDMITSNAGWLSSGEVRRALLTNPRVSDDGILRVLRNAPKPELQLIATQTHYPPRVRKAARTLLNR